MDNEKLQMVYRLLNSAIIKYADGEDESVVIENIIHARAILEHYGIREPKYFNTEKFYDDTFHDGRSGFQFRLYMMEGNDEKN